MLLENVDRLKTWEKICRVMIGQASNASSFILLTTMIALSLITRQSREKVHSISFPSKSCSL